MVLTKLEVNSKQTLKLILIVTGSCLFLAPSILELSPSSASGVKTDFGKTTETVATNHTPILLIAQAFLDDRCPEQYVYLQGETDNYKIKICGQRGTGNPTHYLGESKKNGSSILLPLSSYTEGRFVARNGRYTYILDVKAQTLTIRIPRQRPRVERFTIDLP